MNHKKQNGVYYTPEKLANFIVNHLFCNYYSSPYDLDILEPSCGNGVFLNSIIAQQGLNPEMQLNITGIEIDKIELNKIRRTLKRSTFQNIKFILKNADYLKFQRKSNQKYDLVIGNPPYINQKHLSEWQILLCNEILKKANIEPPVVKNIWVAFLISAVLSLKENGVICFILPSELLQVNHSSSIREFLFNAFNSIEIFTFNEIVFEGIEQDTIIFLGSNRQNGCGLKYYNIDNLENMHVDVINELGDIEDAISGKWTSLILSNDAFRKLESLREGIVNVNDYCVSGAGIVTAANDDFIVNEDVLNKYNLRKYALPIIRKSTFVKNGIVFTNDDLRSLIQSGNPTNLLLFTDQEIELFSENVKLYLDILKNKKIDQRYKFKKRKRWFLVPSVWKSEGFFFKRSYLYPKVIVNDANVLVTDTAYRITMRENYNIDSFVFSFYNSLTLVYAELLGRFYGGGVLELTPNEYKKLPLPYIEVSKDKLLELDRMFRNNYTFEEILDFTNSIILKVGLNFKDEEINFLNNIRKLLINRRLKTKDYSLSSNII